MDFFWIWTNYCKLSWNFVGAIRTTTTNCRVRFIDLYLIFPTNFRIVFLPHTNTVILLEPYCGSITEPGLPVITRARLRGQDFTTGKNFSFNQCHTKSFAFFLGNLFYKSNRKRFSCVCIAWYKHSRRWENSRQLCSNSPNPSRVNIRLSKHGKRFLLLKRVLARMSYRREEVI